MARGEVLWEPTERPTRVGRFMEATGHRGWDELLSWSLTEPAGFWSAIAEHLQVVWRSPPEGGVALAEPAAMPGAVWFPGARLNYAEHALRHAATAPDDVAVVARSQSRPEVTMTWAELADQVSRAAAGLRRLGVAKGDRVAAYAPNCAETLVVFLATASIGAVWASCAPEFGPRSVVDRLAQIEPTVLLAVDGYRYGAKEVDRTAAVDAIVDGLSSLRHVVALRHLGRGPDGYADLVADHGPLEHEPVAFDHPLYVLFSSGTTGLPKAIVHGHGGITLEHLKVLALHQDLGPDDRFLWFTTTAWMMWNYLVSGLLVGATVVLYDGDPGHPDLTTLWRLAAQTRCTVFGTSAPFLMACRKGGLTPGRDLDLSQLRSIGSTGAPLPAEGFRWVRDAVGPPVNSISGGTDVCTAFVGMVPVLPVRAGEISTRYLGCAVEAFDPAGNAVAPGVTGELVVTRPMPSMPVAFWGDDPDQTKLRASYFDEFPGVWRHGDWITFTDDGACTITGRSDATLNRGGVRLGTGDFYAVVESMQEIADSLVVHLDDRGGESGELVLFVVLAPGAELDDDLRARVSQALRTDLSPRHVPDRIEAVPAVPRTLSGKKLEVPVKRILTGTPPEEAASREALVDPTALDHFVGR